MNDRYGDDVLAGNWRRPRAGQIPQVPLEHELVVESAIDGFCGAVTGWDRGSVTLEDRHRRERVFTLDPAAFLIDGRPVTLVQPVHAPSAPVRTASGSLAVPDAPARVARESRIYVEGTHDAELLEHIWGHDLRVEGVVVEPLGGVDDLPRLVTEFGPGPGRRLGVLVDHLVPGSKEARIAAQVAHPHVLITGHPFVDVWAAVRPSAVGIQAWPDVPRGLDWKTGVLRALKWPMEQHEAWRHILGSVRGYGDLEPQLLGRVEELIDFVTDLDGSGS
ncbi:DUF3097 domain-containing protein [Spiractinospora alimapuensis]|uniref:DUF3097 domain-containing protein n=1 Tax=Spiractinospora alimapuensis TaxID=2820884 RepID=UPI001F2E6485|nr:DUF3097 domain-containing protein [Spiractinospora alimapuensis]QVQ54750.1 DUF3097 domain-containing protein [Spiractinospora alimapuensis]